MGAPMFLNDSDLGVFNENGTFHAQHIMKNLRASFLCHAEVPAENLA
jgi:hypothetical protein